MDAAVSVARASRIRARKKRIRCRRVFCGTRGKRMVRARALLFLSFFLCIFRYLSVRRSPKNKNLSLFLFLTSFLTEDNEHDAEVNATHAENARFENLETIIERARRKMETVLEKSIEKEKREEEKQNVLTENKKWSAKSGNACKATARCAHRDRGWREDELVFWNARRCGETTGHS